MQEKDFKGQIQQYTAYIQFFRRYVFQIQLQEAQTNISNQNTNLKELIYRLQE